MALLTAGGMATAPLCPAQEPGAASPEVQEKAHRTMAIRDALQQVQEARLAYSAKRYTDAVEHYRNALSVLPKAPATRKQEKFIRESLSDALIARAIDYRSVGRIEEAVGFLREAIQLAPDNQRAKLELGYTEDSVRTNPSLTPEHVGNVEEVSRLLTLGYGYLDLGKYDEALNTFRSVQQYDQYNSAAKRGIEAVEKQRAAYYKSAYDARRAEMFAEVGKQWDNLDANDSMPTIIPEAQGDPSGTGSDGEIEQAHVNALEAIHIPSLVLEETGIEEAIEIINSMIRRESSQNAAPQNSINITTDFGARDSDAFKNLAAKRVSLQLNEVSLLQAIGEIARHFGLEYYVVPSGIELSLGEHGDRLVNRTFTGVGSHIFDRESGGDSEDEDDDDFADKGRVRVRRIDPKHFFKSQGVSFPKGSHIAYYPNSRRLEISNTRHNIDKIATILNNSDTKEWNVVLNMIVVETDETNVEDLGFDWLFDLSFGGGEQTLNGGLDQAASSVTGMPLLSTQAHTGRRFAPAVTQGLRSIGQISNAKDLNQLIELGSVSKFAGTDARSSMSPTIFGVRGVWTAADVTLLMRGLSQKKGTDTLHNPRLTLNPNTDEGVSFTNVREMFAPTSYDPPQIQSGGGGDWYDDDDDYYDNNNNNNRASSNASVAITSAHPTDFERYGADDEKMDGIGAMVRVHKAEPSADGRQVKLTLTTVINEFEGFIDWGSPIYSVMWTPRGGSDGLQKLELAPNHIFMPIFKRYVSNTSLTIANGAVLVIGGLREARVVRYEDKVPILGDLPLVGRLFRSEGEKRSRRAVMIFAKVNIVDPTGRDITSGEEDTAAQSPTPL